MLYANIVTQVQEMVEDMFDKDPENQQLADLRNDLEDLYAHTVGKLSLKDFRTNFSWGRISYLFVDETTWIVDRVDTDCDYVFTYKSQDIGNERVFDVYNVWKAYLDDSMGVYKHTKI